MSLALVQSEEPLLQRQNRFDDEPRGLVDFLPNRGGSYFVFSDTADQGIHFTNSFMNVLLAKHNGCMDVEILDHTWPSESAGWKLAGKAIKPTCIDMRETAMGIRQITKQLALRSQANKASARNNKSLSIFKPSLKVIAHANEMAASAIAPLRFCMQGHGSTNMAFLCFGLSSDPGAYGLNRADMLKAHRFWVGEEMALQGIESLQYLPSTVRMRDAFLFEVETLSAQGTAFALIKAPGYQPRLLRIPEPEELILASERFDGEFAAEPAEEIADFDLQRLTGMT